MAESHQAIAQAVADSMYAKDAAAQALGITLLEVRPGYARMAMAVRPDMLNGHGTCHGGFIFTLADSAFAFACNTYDQRTVAQQCAVTFLQPGRRGDRLTAHAVERNRTGRSGIYDVTVRNSQGEVVAEFRGHSRTIAGTLLATGADETDR